MSMRQTHQGSGFILPATILLGLAISVMSVTFLQYIANASQMLNSQTYASLAQEAARSGITYALSCINAQADSTKWQPLKPNSDCSGSTSAYQNVTPYVAGVPGQWRSWFEVPASTDSGGQKKIVSTGTVEILAGGVSTNKITKSQDITIMTTLDTVIASSGNSLTDIQSDTHSCAIANGQLYCWGDNGNGQLGLGNTTDQATPQLVAATNPGDAFYNKKITKLAVGTGDTCAVADGQLYCWGDNSYGQLGDGTKTSQTTPKLVPTLASNKITSISLSQATTGGKSACAVTNGMIYCWGSNASQQLGQTTNSTTAKTTDSLVPIRVYGYNNGDGGALSGKKTQYASVGMHYGCSSTQGSAYCWGRTTGTAAAPAVSVGIPSGIPDPTNVKVTGDIACAIEVGQLYCKNDGPSSFSSSATIGGGPGLVTSGAATSYDGNGSTNSACAVDTKAQNAICGSSIITMDSSVQARAISQIGSGNQYYCMISNGALACGGTASKGQLANGSMTSTQANAQWVDWSSGFGTDNSPNGNFFPFAATGQISAGTNHACALANGTLFCWGLNSSGQLGLGSTTNQIQPTYLLPEISYFTFGVARYATVEKVAAGGDHTCAIVAHITQDWWEVLGWPFGVGYTPVSALYCWGANTNGELGINNTTTKLSPTRVGDLFGSGSDRITDVSAGASNTCAIAKYQLYCWGDNTYGQLGVSGGRATTPQLVPGFSGKQVTSVSVGTTHICAIVNGDGYCWGDNTYNQTGSATKPANPAAGKITTGTANVADGNLTTGTFTSIAAGNGFTCATINGTASCWGKNDVGQTGTGLAGTVTIPTAIGGGYGSLQSDALSAGDTHACAVMQGNTYCWGDNTDGRIGNNTTSGSQTTPFLVNTGAAIGQTAINVATGGSTTCSVANADILCWGRGNYGQLGVGTFSSSSTPLKVPYLRRLGANTISPIY